MRKMKRRDAKWKRCEIKSLYCNGITLHAHAMKHRLLFIILAAMLPTLPALADGETQRLQSLANALHAQGKTDSAITVARCMQARAATQHDTTALVGAGSALGVYLRSQGKLEEALKSYDEALRLVVTPAFVRTTDAQACEAVATLYMNLATLHVDMQNKAQATNCARKSEAWAARCPDAPALAGIHMGTASVFLMCGEPEAAARGFSKAAVLAERADNYETALGARSYLAYVLRTTGQEEEAARCERRAEALLPHVESVTARAMYYQLRFVSEMNAGRYRQAIATGHEALALPGINGFPFIVYDFYNNIHEAYAHLGNYRLAYETLARAGSVRDTLYEKEKAESLRELAVRYETREKELALAEERAQRAAELAAYRLRMGATGGVFAACVAAFVFFFQRQRTRTARERLRAELSEKEYMQLRHDTTKRLTGRYIEGLENERARLSAELHDGICNDLLAIEMQMRAATGEGGKWREMLEKTRESVRRVSHELLPPEFREASLDEVLADYLHAAGEGSACSIGYSSYAERPYAFERIAPATALEVYRIVQEAVGNAMKHAGATRIDVGLHLENGRLALSVSDDGRGAEGSRRGIGLRTMKKRAEAVGGSMQLTRTERGSTLLFLTDLA